MTETPETRLKRLRLRSWRRGTREMDLILGPYADEALPGLDGPALDAFEALLDEADADLYAWVAGTAPPPVPHEPAIGRVRAFHRLG
ncbi:MAG TPA: succinate dehydrogenase assembly factor 2 [Paracoccaceae bacterium]|nr:succinate dehydrogenase assembly factor 2 [Paracoccaceae bacterium]